MNDDEDCGTIFRSRPQTNSPAFPLNLADPKLEKNMTKVGTDFKRHLSTSPSLTDLTLFRNSLSRTKTSSVSGGRSERRSSRESVGTSFKDQISSENFLSNPSSAINVERKNSWKNNDYKEDVSCAFNFYLKCLHKKNC